MPRTAKVTVELVSVACPKCGQDAMIAPNGSINLTPGEVDANNPSGVFACVECGVSLTMPKMVRL